MTIWITGASQGIGRALALHALANDTRPIAVSARSAEALAELASHPSGRVHAFPLDVRNGATVAATVNAIENALGPISLAVLNAGSHQETPVASFSATDMRNLMDLNYMGVVHGLDALLQRMRARQSGHIAVTASVAGYRGLPRAGGYCASKAALIALCESLKCELDGDGIKLQVCCPGFVRTPLTDRNRFSMPHLMEAEDAARAYWQGLQANGFEIAFPKAFTRQIAFLRMVPYFLYFTLIRRATGVGR